MHESGGATRLPSIAAMFGRSTKDDEQRQRVQAHHDSPNADGWRQVDREDPEAALLVDPEAARAKALSQLANDLEQWPLSRKEEEEATQRKIKEMKAAEKHDRLMKVGGRLPAVNERVPVPLLTFAHLAPWAYRRAISNTATASSGKRK
jgi:hypothetical protein